MPNPVNTYIYIYYIWLDCWFYVILTFLCYLLPNPLYTYILYMVWFYGISSPVGFF